MNRVMTSWRAAAMIVAAAVVSTPAVAQQSVRISVDLREAPRHIFHTSLIVPASGSTQSLTYPKWIQGHHTASGPLMDVVGLRVTAGGKPLAWNRDSVDLYTIRVETRGASEVEVDFDFVFP